MTSTESVAVSWRAWLAVGTMSLGTFAMATVEGLPIGLLPFMSRDLDVSQGMIGLSVTIPGVVAAATAPMLPLVFRTLDRRLVLLGLLVLVVIANLVTAAAPTFGVLLASRFVVGVCIGGFWSLAAVVAVQLVPEQHVTRALSITFTGATAASVLGIPLGSLIGTFASWRAAFVTMGALAVIVAVAIVVLLPALPPARPVVVRTLVDQLHKPGVRGAVMATLLLVGGHYTAFTFLSPVLLDVVGVEERLISPLLFVFGIAAVMGTLVVGSAAGRDVQRSIITLSLVFALTLASFPIIGTSTPVAVVLLVVWGLAFGGVPVAVQTWIVQAAGNETEAATALNTSAYNFAIAAGALIGAMVVDSINVAGALLVGAALVGATSLVTWAARRTAATAR